MIINDLFEAQQSCPHCGGPMFSEMLMMEKKDACYYKVKASAKVWPSAYASGRLVQCRKKGADNYGNKSEGVAEATGDQKFDSMMGQITGGATARQSVDSLNKSLTARTGGDPETALAKWGQEFINWLEKICRNFERQGVDRFKKLEKVGNLDDGGETMAHWLIEVAKQSNTSGITQADIQEFSSEFNTHGMWAWHQFPIAWGLKEWQDYKDQWTGPDGYMANLGQGMAEGLAQDEAQEDSGWRAEFVNEINYNTFEVKLTNTRSKESANFIVRPVDMVSYGPTLSIETMDVHDLQTGQTESWTNDDPAPDGPIAYAISGLFYDDKQLQKKLQNIIDTHDTKGQDMMPGLEKRRSIGQEVDADAYIDSQEKTQAAMAKMKKGVAEKLGDNRPKLGSKRDAGKSIRKWRSARGLDETDVVEATAAPVAGVPAPGVAKPAVATQPATAPAQDPSQPYLDKLGARAGAAPGSNITQVTDAYQQKLLDRMGKRFGLPPGSTMDQVNAAQQAYLDKNDPAAAAQYKQNMTNINAGNTAANKPVQLAPKPAPAPNTDAAGGQAAAKANKSPIAIMLAQPTIGNNQAMLDVIAPTLGLPAGSSAEQILAADNARNAKAKNKYAAAAPAQPVAENAGRAVNDKGLTQHRWLQLVQTKFPDAKIVCAKMIDGPCRATLPDGRTLSWVKAEQGVAEGDLNEKSTSQAQFRTMAAAAHNPKFAKKVGISQDVAQEFHSADKNSNYKKLPDRTTEGEQQKGADYRDPPEADYGDDYQDMVARVKKLAGLGPLKTVYDPAKRVYRNVPTAQQPKK